MGAERPQKPLQDEIDALIEVGYRLRMITPADAPRRAELERDGTVISIGEDEVESEVAFDDDWVFVPGATDGGAWGDGRAGMQYRDLIPERHGGHVIASHIRIPTPGPVPDYVHHHDIDFQVIHVRRGSVQVVYEDQGDPFWMHEGDTVLQPPHIRHRVLASDGGCEVIEVVSPAEHPTFVDHDLALPNGVGDPSRSFGGQRYAFADGMKAEWVAVGDGWECQPTGFAEATSGVGDVRQLRSGERRSTITEAHDGTVCLFVCLVGTADLTAGDDRVLLEPDDSIAVPSGSTWTLAAEHPSQLLQVMIA